MTDPPKKNQIPPALSTVDMMCDSVSIGAAAVDLMMEAKKWHRPGVCPPEISLPYQVVERARTGVRRVQKKVI
jgi:hypothetical protein